jgi:hypothetical protein
MEQTGPFPSYTCMVSAEYFLWGPTHAVFLLILWLHIHINLFSLIHLVFIRYLVEKLSTRDIDIDYNPDLHEMTYMMSTAIGKKFDSDKCPDGFIRDDQHLHCRGKILYHSICYKIWCFLLLYVPPNTRIHVVYVRQLNKPLSSRFNPASTRPCVAVPNIMMFVSVFYIMGHASCCVTDVWLTYRKS